MKPIQCMTCKNVDLKDGSCPAYPGPNGIPSEILTGEIKHNQVRKGQTGGYIYEFNPNWDKEAP